MIELNTTECKILLRGLDLIVDEEEDSIDYTTIYNKLLGEIELNNDLEE